MEFFKRIFAKKPEEQALELNNIRKWVDEKSAWILLEENESIKKSLRSIEDCKRELDGKLTILENAELMNPDIPEREKHIMEGNRLAYIKKTQLFIEDVKKPDMEYSLLDVFCNSFDPLLSNFNLETSKGYFVLTHFFDKEMRDIAASVKSMETNVIRIKESLNKKHMRQYISILDMIAALDSAKSDNEKFGEELDIMQEDLDATIEKKKILDEKMLTLKESPEFSQVNSIEKKKRAIDEKIQQLNDKLNNTLKSIDKPLKKYMHESLEKELIAEYLESPISAIEKDSGFAILGILEKIEKDVNTFDLKAKQKEKFVKQIRSISREYLFSIKEELETLKKEKHDIAHSMDKSTIIMDYKELEYQVEHVTEKIKRLTDEIKKKNEILENLDIAGKTDRLQKSLSEFSGTNVKIV